MVNHPSLKLSSALFVSRVVTSSVRGLIREYYSTVSLKASLLDELDELDQC